MGRQASCSMTSLLFIGVRAPVCPCACACCAWCAWCACSRAFRERMTMIFKFPTRKKDPSPSPRRKPPTTTFETAAEWPLPAAATTNGAALRKQTNNNTNNAPPHTHTTHDMPLLSSCRSIHGTQAPNCYAVAVIAAAAAAAAASKRPCRLTTCLRTIPHCLPTTKNKYATHIHWEHRVTRLMFPVQNSQGPRAPGWPGSTLDVVDDGDDDQNRSAAITY